MLGFIRDKPMLGLLTTHHFLTTTLAISSNRQTAINMLSKVIIGDIGTIKYLQDLFFRVSSIIIVTPTN